MLHPVFIIAVVIIAIALLPAALAILPWCFAAALVVIGIGVLVALFAYAQEVAVALVAGAGVIASLYSLGQTLRRRSLYREIGNPGIQPHEPIAGALEQLHEALTERLKNLEHELQISREHIQPTVERRKQLAKSVNLGERLLLVVGNIKYYPSWCDRDPAAVCDLLIL